jgi:hypothetical protein
VNVIRTDRKNKRRTMAALQRSLRGRRRRISVAELLPKTKATVIDVGPLSCAGLQLAAESWSLARKFFMEAACMFCALIENAPCGRLPRD